MTNKALAGIFSLVTVLGVASLAAPTASADFAKRHPRRAQVVRREKHEQKLNNQAAVDGKITDMQARHLDKEDRHIRQEERRDAAANGGHITKAEQRHLNREENSVNRQRARDERKDAAGSTTPAATPPASN